MAILRSIPQTDFPVGQTIIGPDNIPGNVNQYLLVVHQFAWPNLGEKAFDYDCQVSPDGGNTWQSMTSADVYDTTILPHFGQPGGQFSIACTIPDIVNGNRKLRLLLNFAKPITMSIDVQANTISGAASTK